MNEVITLAGVVVCLLSYGIYIRAILKGQARPHLFTWMIFTVLTSIGFLAQLSADAGPGMFITGLSGLGNLTIAVFAFWKGEKNITRSDWVFFIGALAAIPVWLATETPLYAVLMISAIDAMAFYPTFRKSWNKPWDESAVAYALAGLQFFMSVMGMEKINVITALYPLVIVGLNVLLIALLLGRRHALRPR